MADPTWFKNFLSGPITSMYHVSEFLFNNLELLTKGFKCFFFASLFNFNQEFFNVDLKFWLKLKKAQNVLHARIFSYSKIKMLKVFLCQVKTWTVKSHFSSLKCSFPFFGSHDFAVFHPSPVYKFDLQLFGHESLKNMHHQFLR